MVPMCALVQRQCVHVAHYAALFVALGLGWARPFDASPTLPSERLFE